MSAQPKWVKKIVESKRIVKSHIQIGKKQIEESKIIVKSHIQIGKKWGEYSRELRNLGDEEGSDFQDTRKESAPWCCNKGELFVKEALLE